jgi:hypothetical protein
MGLHPDTLLAPQNFGGDVTELHPHQCSTVNVLRQCYAGIASEAMTGAASVASITCTALATRGPACNFYKEFQPGAGVSNQGHS